MSCDITCYGAFRCHSCARFCQLGEELPRQTQLHTVYAAGRAVFAAADLDGDGFLDPQEMTEVLQQLGRPISTADVEQIMR